MVLQILQVTRIGALDGIAADDSAVDRLLQGFCRLGVCLYGHIGYARDKNCHNNRKTDNRNGKVSYGRILPVRFKTMLSAQNFSMPAGYVKEDGTVVEAIEGGVSAIQNINANKVVDTEYYNMQGMRISPDAKGLVIKVSVLSSGKRISRKTINK